MSIRRKGAACDPCCNDWKEKLKFLWENYHEVVKQINVNGLRDYYPDGIGKVSIETWPTVIDHDDYYTLIAIVEAYQSELIDCGTFWLLITEKLISEGTYYDLSSSITLNITNDTDGWILTTAS